MPSKHLYARLELLVEPIQDSRAMPSELATRASRARWRRWGQALLNYFVGSQDPRITTRRNDEGHLYYEVYDPVDRARHYFDSESAVRAWLEERYYQ
ncbi:MAG: hypothetical protein AAF827_22200 [Cyanobacteria bacterium P01_D01_bin.6]